MYSRDPNFLRAEREYLTPPEPVDGEEYSNMEFQIALERIGDTKGWFIESLTESVETHDMNEVQRLVSYILERERADMTLLEKRECLEKIGSHVVDAIWEYVCPSESDVIDRLEEEYGD
jgi:hypothetical protein